MVRSGLLLLPRLPSSSLLCFFVSFLCFSSNPTVIAEGPYCSAPSSAPRDMIQNGAMNPKYMWNKRGHKTYVPVVMDHSYSYKEHSIIVGGLHEIQEKTCVEFDIYDNEAEVEEKDYVYITKNTKRGCYSYIGRIGGKQEIGLPIGCISHRTAMHEMLHALGFRHEHVRYDRDDYIIVFWGNIRPGRESNFKKRSPSDLVSGPYDYDSIMHYERKAFSVNGMETIRPLKPGAKIGIRQKMSYWDARKVNIVYKCGGRGGPGGGYDSDHISYSPALLRINDDHDRNQSLPIAEYDDFNGDDNKAAARSLDNGGGHGHGHNGPTSFHHQNLNDLSFAHEDEDHHHDDHSNHHEPERSRNLNYERRSPQHHGPNLNDHHDSSRRRGEEFLSDNGGGGERTFHNQNGNSNRNDNGEPYYSTDDDTYDY